VAKKSVDKAVFRFRVELRDLAPTIWREIEVPGSYSFWDLHVAIQDAMGWLDYHLHAFQSTETDSNGECEIGIPTDDELQGSQETMASWEVPVRSHFTQIGDHIVYLYDFGDGWTHDIILDAIIPCKSPQRVTCTGGERACPPEDCGGAWGYQTMLEALADATHERHEDMVSWIGDSFDPEYFEPSQVKFDDPKERWDRAFNRS
jgi:hypothetical protein